MHTYRQSAGSSSTQRLWKEYFTYSLQWWNKLKCNVSVRRHLDAFCTDGRHNPSWVNDNVKKTECSSKGMLKARSQELQESSGWEISLLRENIDWEMPSLEEALTALERMPQPFSVENFTCILHKCRKKKNLANAVRLHAYMHKSGLDTHPSIGNYLVPMLVEAGSICHAEQVFDRLMDRNEYSWTSLITGYIECGESQHALILYQKMKEDSVHPSGHTFVAVLKACARLKNAERGQEIHAEIAQKGLERDPFVGSTLVDMYAKCGWLAIAREVFDKLPVHDAVSWTALIAGYAEHGLGQEALNCFEQMQLEGVSQNAFTFVCSLQACSIIGAIDKGREIHVEIARRGLLERNIFVGNALVDMYIKCGALAKALKVFDKLPVRDAVLWTAVIAGHVKYELGQEALDFFDQMQLEGVPPDAFTFVCSLKACASTGATDKGHEIHMEISRKGLEKDLVIGSTLVDMYAKCGLPAKARGVFDQLPARNVVSWTAMIAGYVEHGLDQEALDCFKQMQLEGVSPNAVTFVCSLKACVSIGVTDKVQEIHAEIARMGLLELDPCVGNALVDMYAKLGLLAKAQEVFDKLPVQNQVSWNALIAGYANHALGEQALNGFEQMQLEGVSPNAITFACSLKACGSIGAIDTGLDIHAEISEKGLLDRDSYSGNALIDMFAKCGSLRKACEVFDKLPVRDAVSWTALIAGYAENGFSQEALNRFEQMQLEGVFPNAVTFVCSLKACGSLGAIEKGQQILLEIFREGLLERDPFVANTVVDMYAKCGSLVKAQEVFDKLPVRSDVSWNALITGYARLGESENVFHMLDRMTGEGIKPGEVTFLSVLTVCSHTGLVEKGQTCFEAMNKDYGIIPTIEHHTCMVDLLGRAGRLEEAVGMMKKMPFNDSLVVWHSVLGACRNWGNVQLGRQAFEHAVQLNEKDAAAYVLMSNIYADAHMQEDDMEG